MSVIMVRMRFGVRRIHRRIYLSVSVRSPREPCPSVTANGTTSLSWASRTIVGRHTSIELMPGDGYWGISAAPAGEERSPEQGRHLAYDVGEQGYRGELGGVGGGTLHVGDEHRREGVVSEPRCRERDSRQGFGPPSRNTPAAEKSSVPMMVAAGSRIMPAPNDCFMCCRSFEAPRPMPT